MHRDGEYHLILKFKREGGMTDHEIDKSPDISVEMWDEIDKIISDNKSIPGSIITVLRECQNVVGYLPEVLIDRISSGLNVAASEVFGIASFYSLFLFEPKGRNQIKVCMGTACYVKGMNEIKNRIHSELKIDENGNSPDMRYSLEAVRCVGACGLAPVMVVNEDTHAEVTTDNVIEKLEKYT